jgi:excisionase family DNA binding protein
METNEKNSRLTMTIPEAAKLLGLSRNGAYEAAKRGEIPAIRIGGRILVPRHALEEFLNSAIRPRRLEAE